MPNDVLLLLVASAAVAWVAYRVLRMRQVDQHFGVRLDGGRDGNIHVRCPGFGAVTYYEVGGAVDLIVHRRDMRTLDGKDLSREQQDEVIQRLRDWGKARGTSIEIGTD
jgi:hypothetical protein